MSNEFNKDKYYEEKEDQKLPSTVMVTEILNVWENKREERILKTMSENSMTREEAEAHIDYMDSERYSDWVMGNRTSLELSNEKMERALEKDLDKTKFE